jgi:predicted ArsR family transcriptional regulator
LFYKKNMKTTKTAEKILLYLKMNGPQSASDLAKVFGMSSEGMRLHLLKLEERDLIQSESQTKGVGRPTIHFGLTLKGSHRFPDKHANLTVQLLESVQQILGQEALQLLLDHKQDTDFNRYDKQLSRANSTEEKLQLLTEIRNLEGYMTSLEKVKDDWLFIENNCPIHDAAKKCNGFCLGEIENIRKLLGEKITVERTDHTAAGDRRCTYRIR